MTDYFSLYSAIFFFSILGLSLLIVLGFEGYDLVTWLLHRRKYRNSK